MRIRHGVQAALTILMLAGVGAAGCNDEEPDTTSNDFVGVSTTTTTSTSTSTSKTKSPALIMQTFETSSGVNSTGDPIFILTGIVRNIGDATGTLGVNVMASDNGIAIMSKTAADVEVPELYPSLASKFTMEVEAGVHRHVLFTFWGTVNGKQIDTPYYWAEYTLP